MPPWMRHESDLLDSRILLSVNGATGLAGLDRTARLNSGVKRHHRAVVLAHHATKSAASHWSPEPREFPPASTRLA